MKKQLTGILKADGTFLAAGPVDFDLSERTYPIPERPVHLDAIAGGSDDDDDDTTPTLGGRVMTDADAISFILAGNATVTFKSLRTGTHFTFKVQEPKKQDPARPTWFVKLLTGPDNTGDYTYLGMITVSPFASLAGPLQHTFRATKATRNPGSPSFKAFEYTFNQLAKTGRIPAGVEIRHEGRCGRCGRALTVPESIDRGIGPECASRMGA